MHVFGGLSLKISIITATYNAADDLLRLICSLQTQTFKKFEWVVADGGSTDGTLEILSQIHDISLVVDSRPDLGIYDAWNRALDLASGEWVCFLGADDLIIPDAISKMLAFATESAQSYDFISGRAELYRGDIFLRAFGKPWDWRSFKRYMCVAHPGSLHRMSYFDRYGLFDTSFKIAGDYEMLLRSGPSLKAGFLDKVVVRMQTGGQSTGNKIVFKETYRARLMHGATTPLLGKIHAKWAEMKWRARLFLGSV